jgi:hypothetical protein
MEASASLKTLSARVILDYWRPLKHPFFKHVIDVYDRIDGDLSQNDADILLKLGEMTSEIDDILS